MRFLKESQTAAVVPLAAMALAGYYLFVFLPLSHRADSLETALGNDWKKLVAELHQPSNTVTLDFESLAQQLSATTQSLAAVQFARKQAAARFELSRDLRSKMSASFQNLEFENQRGERLEELFSLAKKQQVALDESEMSLDFAYYPTEMVEPSLHWPALSMADGLLATAIQCKVSAIHAFTSLLPSGGGPMRPAQIRFKLEVSGPAPNVLRLIRCLPLRGDELAAAGLTNGPPAKLPLLLDRLVIKKQSPDKPNEVRAALVVGGFVFNE